MSTATIRRGKLPHRIGSLGRLRAIRQERRMPHTDLADKSGVTVLTISRAENGRGVHAETVAKLAGALGVNPGDLYTRPEDLEQAV